MPFLVKDLHSAESVDEKWLCVNLDLFANESIAPCDLFRKVHYTIADETRERHVLFAQAGFPFEAWFRARLAECGVRELYIRNDDAVPYLNYVKKVTQSVLQDDRSTNRQKAAAVYSCCHEIMKEVYHQPRSIPLKGIKSLIEPTVETILADAPTTHALIRMASFDSDTYTHCTNVGIFGVAFAKSLFGPRMEREIRRLAVGFFLHDIGKCEVPIEILNKPGALSVTERQVIERHPDEAIRLLKQMGVRDEETLAIATQHHERDDGRGYSIGLDRQSIHPFARICRLADIFEALTSNRPYHNRRSSFEALKYMQNELVADVDKDVFEAFVKIFSYSPRL